MSSAGCDDERLERARKAGVNRGATRGPGFRTHRSVWQAGTGCRYGMGMNAQVPTPPGADGMYQQFELHFGKNIHVTAEAVARQMQARFPEDERSHVAVARITAARGRPQSGMALLEALDPLANRLPHACAHLAEMKLAAGAVDDAAALAQVALDCGALLPAALKVAGTVALQRGKHAEAVQLLSRLLTQQPTDVQGWKGLAQAYRGLKRPRPACQALEHALAVDKKDVETWMELCRARVEAGEVEQARKEVTDALNLHPRHAELLKEANRIRQLGTATSDPLARELDAARDLMDRGLLGDAEAKMQSIFKLHRPTRAMKFARAELDAAQPGVDVPAMITNLIPLTRQYAEAWEPRALHADLLMRPSRMRNVRQALTHAEEAWTMSGGNPRVGLVLMRAYRETGRAGLAEALGAQIRTLSPAFGARVDAALKP